MISAISRLILCLLITLELTNCSSGSAPSSSSAATSGGIVGQASASSLAMINEINTLNTTAQSNQKELNALNTINAYLCQRLQGIRTNCLVHVPLISSVLHQAGQNLDCSGSSSTSAPSTATGSTPAPATIAAQVTVTSSAGSAGNAQFTVVGNDNYTSNTFSQGNSQALTFTVGAQDNVSAPDFTTIYKLIFRSTVPLDASATASYAITVNGATLFKGHSTVDGGTLTDFPVDLSPMFQMVSSSTCQMTQDEYNKYTQKLASQMGLNTSSNTLLYDPNTMSSIPSTATLNSSLQSVQNQITQINSTLQSARNRNMQLRATLITPSNAGCHLRDAITQIDIEVTGKMGTMDQGSQGSPKTTGTESTASILSFDLGNMQFQIDLGKNNIFNVKYSVPDNFGSADLIGGMNKLSLAKKGAKYDSISQSCNQSGGIFAGLERVVYNPTCYIVSEEDVMTISGIKIYANSKLVFSEDGINVTLQDGSLTWTYGNNFQSNDAWIQNVMEANDCNASQ